MVSLNDHEVNGSQEETPPGGGASWIQDLDHVSETGGWGAGETSHRVWHDHYPVGIPSHLSYPQQQLGWLLHQAAERYPTRVACQYYNERLTYCELLSQAERLAAVFIREGLQPGDRVGILLPNLPETLVSLFATWMACGVVVSLSPLMVASEVESLIKATDCRFVVTLDVLSPLVCQGEHVPELVVLSSLSGRLSRLEQLGYAWVRFQKIGFGSVCSQTRVLRLNEAIQSVGRGTSIDGGIYNPAFVLPTGGTTGRPKAVTLSHANLIAQSWQLSHWSRSHHGEEVILAVLPFFHSYGLSTSVMMGVAMGATLVLHHRFRPASVVRLIEEHRCSIFLAVPAMLSALNTNVLRNRDYDLKSLRAVISGGAALPPVVAKEFQDRTGAVVIEGYGLSEASPVTHAGPIDGTAIPGTIGLPLPDTDARIVDSTTGTETLPDGSVGELLVRGPQVMLGYWNNPEGTNDVIRDGWLHTGDLGCHDDRGFFMIVDRKKDLIITSGFNVYPGDVEAVLRNYPGVKDVAVVGVPDENKGEIVKAVLVVDSAKNFNKRDFDNYTRHQLAAHKRPLVVEASEQDLPRNFLGKVLRRKLRDDETSEDASSVEEEMEQEQA